MAQRWKNGLVLLAGIAMSVTGLALSAMYFIEGIVRRLGEPDQSLAFWYLPILMLGVVLLGAGMALLVKAGLGRRRHK